MKIDLSGKTALVTGGAQGIGKAIAEALAGCGCDIAVADLKADTAWTTAEQIREKHKVQTFPVSVDVSQYGSVEDCVNKVTGNFGKIDILVNNAGVTKDTLMIRMSPEDFDFVLNINLKGTFNFSRCAGAAMLKQKSGRIINIASIIGLIGNAGQANYAASKGGVIALTKTTAKEFASRNITCNAVAPGFIDTEMTRKLPENIREEMIKLIPMKKYGLPEDVAGIVLFLSSDLARYVTGQVIVVDGGMVM